MAETEGRSAQDIGQDEAWATNLKRTYDEYQDISLESIKRNRTITDKLLSDAQQFDNARQVMANQAMQNAIETANLVGKQAVRDAALATDRQWNIDEQGYTARDIINSPSFAEAMKAAIVGAVTDALNEKKA